MKKEFLFVVEQDEEMLVATCHDPEMATQGNELGDLVAMIRDLLRCRFGDQDERATWAIRLHFAQDLVIPSKAA